MDSAIDSEDVATETSSTEASSTEASSTEAAFDEVAETVTDAAAEAVKEEMPQFEVEAPKFDFDSVSKATESGDSLVEEETKKASQDIVSKIGMPEANVNGDTGSIVLEEALDNNSGVHVDYHDFEEESFEEKLRREAAEKDHSIDSAFDFMDEDK